MTKWYERALSGLIAASMGISLVGGMPHAAAAGHAYAQQVRNASEAVGDITTKIRMAYPITMEKLLHSQIQVELLRHGSSIAVGALNQREGTFTFTDGSTAQGYFVVHPEEDGVQAAYVDVQFLGLSAQEGQNTYRLRLSGQGFKPYEQEVTLDLYSKALLVRTDDRSFTMGDLNADGIVDQGDITQMEKALAAGNQIAYDINGDGKLDISDLATVTLAAGATGEAQVRNTALIVSKAVSDQALEQIKNHVSIGQDEEIASLFQDDGKAVTLRPIHEDDTQIELPILLSETDEQAIEMEQVQIVSSVGQPLDRGVLVIETADSDNPITIPFDESTPDGVYALLTRDDGRKTITISLGNRVPVKKVTIKVEVKDDKPVVVEQIKFIQDIVPENPAVEDTQVKGLKAVSASEQVTLHWDAFPNITGYQIYYGTSADQMTNVIKTDRTSYTIENLKNLTTYYFAVSPIVESADETWEGRKSAVVSAMPEPAGVPDKPDNVQVEPGDGLLIVTWKPGKDTVKSKVQYRKQGDTTFTVLDGSYDTRATITGLQNDVTYEIQVYGTNQHGNGPVSLTALGTPEEAKIVGPTLPSANRMDSAHVVSATYPTSNVDWNLSKGTLPGSVYDDDYNTSWIAKSWWVSHQFSFTFDQPYSMNYLVYVPDLRNDPDNAGHRYRDYFDKFQVHVNGQKVDTTWEAAKDNQYFIVKFPKSEVTTLSVEASQWAGAGDLSLSEIAFYQYDGLDEEIAALFDNDSHTQLRDGVNGEQIEALRARVQNQQAYYVDRSVLLDELDNAQQLLDGQQLMVQTGFVSRSASGDAAFGQSASALQPLGLSARSKQFISVYVEGLGQGDTLNLVQWQQYSETGATTQTYRLQNGRNRIWLSQIGNAGSGERGGSLYVQYSGSHADALKIQVRDTSDMKDVVTQIPMLNLSADQWYEASEQTRKQAIQTYVQTLQTYVQGLTFANEGAKRTNTRNVTEIATPSVLLSLPANQVLDGLGGANATVEQMTDRLYQAIQAWEQLIFLVNKTQGIIDADASFDTYRYPMQTRQNIRFSRLFSGAFMFAAGTYVGIDYNETRGMVTGTPLEALRTRDADDVNGLYGWGIAHEIGHNMDKIGYAEITNNIYSLVAQTANAQGDLTGSSRLEGMYSSIFDKVALSKPGQASNVFVQLGMYWQLHLAYDEGGNVLDGSGPLDFYNQFFRKWKDGAYSDASKDDRIALIASEVTGKNLTEFFTRWGMELSPSTKQKLAGYDTEPREIWYLTDDSRRLRLQGQQQAQSMNVNVETQVDNHTVNVTITVDEPSQIQGYEILRNGMPIAFLKADGSTSQTYVDQIGAANHMAFAYQVRVIDKLGYEVVQSERKDVHISYDKTIDPSSYDIVRDEDTGDIIITAKNGQILTTGGLKIDGAQVPNHGAFTVKVSQIADTIPDEPVDEIPMIDLVPAQPIEPEEQPPVEEEPEPEIPESGDSQPDEPSEDESVTEPPMEDQTEPTQPEDSEDHTQDGAQSDNDQEVPSQDTTGESEAEQPEEDSTQPDQSEDDPDQPSEQPENGQQDEVTGDDPSTDEELTDGQMQDTDESTDGVQDAVQDQQPESDQQPYDEPVMAARWTPQLMAALEQRSFIEQDWIVAKQGDFSDSESDNVFLTYFNKPGADDTRIWMYDAKQVVISGVPSDVALEDIALLSYPGDHIAFTQGASIGVLAHDYVYDTIDGTECIPQGTIVITGSYRGDPLYNSVRIAGRFQTMKPGTDDAPSTQQLPLAGYALLLAEIPQDGEVSNISDGIFLFVPDDQEIFQRVNEDHEDNHMAGNDVLVEIQAQMYRAEDVDGSNPRKTSDTLFISVPRFESMPAIELTQE